ncbi:MAG: GDSL-type esterase/lipase family protein [Ignavibacteriaceae bacterium]
MKIMLTGDSITSGFKTTDLMPGFDAVNAGIYGDNSPGLLKRLENDLSFHNPDYLFILIGTNDFALGRSITEIVETLREIIIKAKDFLPEENLYITPLLPTKNVENRPNSSILELNRLIEVLARDQKINCFHLHARFIDENGDLKQEFTDDGLHLTPAAYSLWAALLSEKISTFNK